MAEPRTSTTTALAAAPLLLLPALMLITGADSGMRLAAVGIATLLLIPGLQLMTGIGAMPSLAHASLAGIGASAAGLAASHFAVSGPVLIGVGAAAAGAIALALAPALCRLSSIAFVGASLAAAALAWTLLPTAHGLDYDPTIHGTAAIVGLGGLLLCRRIGRSIIGEALVAAQTDPRRVVACGIDPLRARILVFTVAAALAGAAGALLATATSGPLDPFGMGASIALLAAVIVGGTRSLDGALLAAFPLVLLPDVIATLVPQIGDPRLPLAAIAVLFVAALGGRLSMADRIVHALAHPMSPRDERHRT